MGFPGTVMTDDRYKHPKNPTEYVFGKSSVPGAQGYDGSHYGTHDWIADAALRTLRDVIKNPLFFSDWTWLINSDIARNKWPAWKANYLTSSNRHEVIRGYFTFLFATQLPDMKKTEVETFVRSKGYDWGSSVSKKLTYLVTGDKAGQAKLDKAAKLGVEVITWDEFLEIL